MCIYMDEERVMLGMAAPFGQAVGLLAMVRWWWVVGWWVMGFARGFGSLSAPRPGDYASLAPVSVPCERVAARSVVASAVADGTAADETIDYGSRGIMPVCDFDADGVAVDLKPLAKVWLVLIDEFYPQSTERISVAAL